jgi:hypothetical protein
MMCLDVLQIKPVAPVDWPQFLNAYNDKVVSKRYRLCIDRAEQL